jgi:UDP-glucose 4-epimerase
VHDEPIARVLVTGATGFVGRALLPALRGMSVRAALRRPNAVLHPGLEGVLVGEIGPHTDWGAALDGVDAVVHLAAQVHVMRPTAGDRRLFELVNVAGTARLGDAAARAGVRRFVFLSSVKVNGEVTGEHPFRADDPPAPADDYARSKLEGERALARIAAASGMHAAFIRSPLVYGPGVRANFLRLLGWAYRGLPLPLASIDNARSLVSVWNLCDSIAATLTGAVPVDGPLMVSDGEDVSTSALLRLLARAMRRPSRLVPLPLPWLRALSAAAGAGAEFSRLCSSLQVDIGATRVRLGWTPPISLEEGLRRTATWYLAERSSSGARP